MTRAVLWLVLGLALAVVAMVAMVPGALGNLREVSGMVAVVMAAGVPGLALLLFLAVKRRNAGDEEAEKAARAQPDRITPIATSPEWDRRTDGEH
jgi:threonine/homoserine/homoserine lactone efflux protein